MALFGKKKTTETSPDAVAPSTDDFSPEALAALAESLESGGANSSTIQARKPVSYKNGSIVGINIGADSMKAVELTAKNGSCRVTGIATAPTPPDSIANGVVMSVNVLADAVKELIAPFKSRKAVTSVAGTGEVIVRVIEVPTMTDAELQENMKTDLDRYIPFPPSEVQWDAAAMRDLPMNPNSSNMDVLLVAARHELIDLHLQLLGAVKLDPRAIDVEPLAAARALNDPFSETNTHVDYDDVCAVLDIGASSTEISILRGDELVFTRTVPIAGNMMTQALADKLNLSFQDAENLKRENGNALPVQTEISSVPSSAPAVVSVSGDESISEEAGVDETFVDVNTDVEEEDDLQSAPAETADPFDLDLFNQGPTQSEPGEQHQQKIPGASDDDEETSQLPSKKAQKQDELDVDGEDDLLPSKTQATAADVEPATRGANPTFFGFDESELDEQSELLPTIEGKPQHTEAPPREDEGTSAPDWDDDSFLPSMTTSESSGISQSTSAFAFPDTEETSVPKVAPVSQDSQSSGFTFSSSQLTPEARDDENASVPTEEMSEEVESSVDDLDLSDILGDTQEGSPVPDIDEGLGGTIELDNTTAEQGLGDSLIGLEASLDVEDKPHDEAAVHAVLKPILDDLSSELRRSMEYHSVRYPDVPVKRLVLIGGGAKLHNLDAYFTQNLGVPAELGDPFANIETGAAQADQHLITENGCAFAVALGLAMRDIIR